MTFKTTFRLFIAVCLLGVVLLLVEYRSRLQVTAKTTDRQVFDLVREPIAGIRITRGEQVIECVKKGSSWYLNEPVRARANGPAIERIISRLESLEWNERISAEARAMRELSLSEYGLDPALLSVSIDTSQRRQTLYLGDPTPLATGRYARRGQSEAVLAVGDDIAGLLPTTVDPLRDRMVLHGTPEKTVRLELSRKGAGFVQLVRHNGTWMIQQPLAARADSAAVYALLQKLFAMQIESFFWDVRRDGLGQTKDGTTLEMAASARTESSGLADDAAQLRVTVWIEGDSLGQELLLGKEAPEREDEVFAKRGENEAIFTVSKDILDSCACDVNTLRDRRIFPMAAADLSRIMLQLGETRLVLVRSADGGWVVEEPLQWNAEASCIRDLTSHLLALSVDAYAKESAVDLATLGLDPPHYIIAVQTVSEKAKPADSSAEGSKKGIALHVGALRDDGQTRYARMGNADDIFALRTSQLAWVVPENVNPLRYRDRTMLALKEESIHRIVVTTATGEYGVERGADQAWISIGTTDMIPETDAIEQILYAVENVRAVSVEAFNPKSLEPYGLDHPSATLTLGMLGDAGIQKSLLISKANEQGQVYALVRGQDIVFAIPETLAALLARPVCVSPEVSSAVPEPESADGGAREDE